MAAIILKQSNPGYIHRHGVAADAFDKTVDSLRMLYNMVPIQGGDFFRQVQPSGGSYRESGFDNVLQLPVINSDTDDVPFVTPQKGFPKNFTTTAYRLGVQAERRTDETQLQPVVERMCSGLMDSYRRLLEYSFADVFNNATATGAAYLGADGMPLASASHPHRIRDTGTWSNVATSGALTHSTFSAMRTNMRKNKDHFGYVNPIMLKKLIVPADLEEAANRIRASEKVAGGNLNDKNIFQNSFDVMVYDYLTSTTVWFGWGDVPKEYCGLIYGPEVPANISPCTGKDVGTDIVFARRLRAIFTVGFMVEPNLHYNAGT